MTGVAPVSAEEMANAGRNASFHPLQNTRALLDVPAFWERFHSVHGALADKTRDVLVSGEWAPSYPPVRAFPVFLAEKSAADDEPNCKHQLGSENQFTGGTFVACCMSANPECIGVVVLDASEGQGMPIEFVVQRMLIMPAFIVYDFACAALKTALCRLPWVALLTSSSWIASTG